MRPANHPHPRPLDCVVAGGQRILLVACITDTRQARRASRALALHARAWQRRIDAAQLAADLFDVVPVLCYPDESFPDPRTIALETDDLIAVTTAERLPDLIRDLVVDDDGTFQSRVALDSVMSLAKEQGRVRAWGRL